MSRKAASHGHLKLMTLESLGYIKESEATYEDGWVPAAVPKARRGAAGVLIVAHHARVCRVLNVMMPCLEVLV